MIAYMLPCNWKLVTLKVMQQMQREQTAVQELRFSRLGLRGPVTGGSAVRQCTTGSLRTATTRSTAAAHSIAFLAINRCGNTWIDLARVDMG